MARYLLCIFKKLMPDETTRTLLVSMLCVVALILIGHLIFTLFPQQYQGV